MNKTYRWPCGCEIGGDTPLVERVFLCNEHRALLLVLLKEAPHSARKVETSRIIVNVATVEVST